MLTGWKCGGKALREVRTQVLVEEEAGHRAPSGGWRVSKAALARGGECQGGSDVIRLQIGEIGQDLRLGHPTGEVLQDVSDGDARAPDAGLPAPDPRGQRNEVFQSHGTMLSASA